jgi:hypothetical protein
MRLQRENRVMQIKLRESKRSQKFIEARCIDLQRALVYGSMPHRSSASSAASDNMDSSSSSLPKLASHASAAQHASPSPGTSLVISRPAMSASSILMARVRARPLPPVLRANVHEAAPQGFARASSMATASAAREVQVDDSTGMNNRSPSPDLPNSIPASSRATSEIPPAADDIYRPLDESCYRASDTHSPTNATSTSTALCHARIETDCAAEDFSVDASAVVDDGSLNESAASMTYRSLSPDSTTSSSISTGLSFTALGLSSSHDPSHFATAADQPPPRLAVEQRAASMPIIFSASLFSPTADAASTTSGQSPTGRREFDFDMGDRPPPTFAARLVPDDAASSASYEPSPVQSPALPTFHRESPPPPSLQTGLQFNAVHEPIIRISASPTGDRFDSFTRPSADSPTRDPSPSSPHSSNAIESSVANSAEPLRSVSPSSVPSHAESRLDAAASSERSSPQLVIQPAPSSEVAEIAAIADSELPAPQTPELILANASESMDSSSVADARDIVPSAMPSVMPPPVEIRPRDLEEAARDDRERGRLARAHTVLQQRADDESKLARLALIQLLRAGVRVTKHHATSRGSRVVRLWFEPASVVAGDATGASAATGVRAAEKEVADAGGWLCWDSASPWSRASRIPLHAIAALLTGRRAPAFDHIGADASPDATAVSIRLRQVPVASARQSLDIHATDASTARLLLPALQALLPHVVVEM